MVEKPLAVITHGWAMSPRKHWIPHTREELERAGYQVQTPRMPKNKIPQIDEWINAISDAVNNNEEVSLISYSCSARAALHFTETHRVKNLVIVAGLLASIDENSEIDEIWREYYSRPLDIDAIRNNCPNIVGLYSDNDPIIPYSQANLFEQSFGKVIKASNQEHFTVKNLPINITERLNR